jgi:penicillin-binding protein 1A
MQESITHFQKGSIIEPSSLVVGLLVAGEDHRFYSHQGVDFIAIVRAIWKRFRFNIIEGASTIEQQLVRVLTGNYERRLKRKIKEIMLATLLSRAFPKEDMAKIYLTIAYYGWRMNGFKQACIRLKLNPRNITVTQAASLVARLKYPEPQNPSSARTLQIYNRVHYILRRGTLYHREKIKLSKKLKNATV